MTEKKRSPKQDIVDAIRKCLWPDEVWYKLSNGQRAAAFYKAKEIMETVEAVQLEQRKAQALRKKLSEVWDEPKLMETKP